MAHVVEGGDVARELLLAVILDGMGGMVDGGEAAALAAAAFVEALIDSPGGAMGRLERAMAAANFAVYGRFGGRGGTTMTALVFADRRTAAVGHVGDSRLYRLGGDMSVSLVTADDTLRGVVEGNHGRADEDALDNRLLQFVGMGDDVVPSFFRANTDDHAIWLLTTDGAHGFGRRALQGAARAPLTPATIVNRLLAGADAFGTEDNATAIAISPHDYSAEALDFAGTIVRIWTATDQMEFWLERKPVDHRQQSPNSVPQADARPAPKRSAKARKGETSKRAKGGRSPKAAATEGDEGQDPPNQLSITFGRPPSSIDG